MTEPHTDEGNYRVVASKVELATQVSTIRGNLHQFCLALWTGECSVLSTALNTQLPMNFSLRPAFTS
jgi:hypothetical protein